MDLNKPGRNFVINLISTNENTQKNISSRLQSMN